MPKVDFRFPLLVLLAQPLGTISHGSWVILIGNGGAALTPRLVSGISTAICSQDRYCNGYWQRKWQAYSCMVLQYIATFVYGEKPI